MVNLTNIVVEYGTQELYRDVNLFLGPGERVGLVGPNGAGKTTIMRMIAGMETPSSGRVEVRRGTRIAYLPQTGGVASERTVLEEALTAFGHLEAVHREMVEVEHRMKEPSLDKRELDVMLTRYAELQHTYHADAFDSKARAKKMLASLGFVEEDLNKRLDESSGGFQVRAMLARILLSEPDLLLLDEPTNYLDIRAIEWLQGYLDGYRGGVLMVAHDRYFLDGLVEHIWAIEGRRVLDFPGNYSEYLADKERREERQQKAFEEQQQFIKKTEQFVAQFKARKDTAKRAQSRQRLLDKLERIDPPRTIPVIRIRFPEADNVYGKAFELRRVAKRYSSHVLFHDVNLAIAGGEKLGIFGPNGAGKTTLLRLIAGLLEPDAGEVWRSEKTEIAYYEQGAEEMLDDHLTVLDAVGRAGGGYTENELKGILGMFLFPGDMVEKRVRVLSGGERSRLAIICALLAPSNLLILDEPTNHLDIQSREMLFRAISQYRRTVVFAAHDRFMLDRLADKTVLVEGGQVVLFPGNYAYATGRQTQRPVSVASRPVPAPSPRQPAKQREPPARPAVNRLVQIEQRLQQVIKDYDRARSMTDFARARELAQERRELEAEIMQRKADELELSGQEEQA